MSDNPSPKTVAQARQQVSALVTSGSIAVVTSLGVLAACSGVAEGARYQTETALMEQLDRARLVALVAEAKLPIYLAQRAEADDGKKSGGGKEGSARPDEFRDWKDWKDWRNK